MLLDQGSACDVKKYSKMVTFGILNFLILYRGHKQVQLKWTFQLQPYILQVFAWKFGNKTIIKFVKISISNAAQSWPKSGFVIFLRTVFWKPCENNFTFFVIFYGKTFTCGQSQLRKNPSRAFKAFHFYIAL